MKSSFPSKYKNTTMESKYKRETESFLNMLRLMEKVRRECPWDSAQTEQTLRTLTIEEIYELSEAILNNDNNNICKELGDVLMHVVFYSLIGKEKGCFDLADVMDSLSEKLIRRHPHVFNPEGNISYEQVEKNWEQIKLKEGNKSALSGVPGGLPSLVKAYRMQDKAKGVGFDWDNETQVLDKVKEEMAELQAEVEKKDNHDRIEQEFGDVLFSLINYSRFIDVNPDTALERTNKKFKRRFQFMEDKVRSLGKSLKDLTLGQMDEIWNEAKSLEQH